MVNVRLPGSSRRLQIVWSEGIAPPPANVRRSGHNAGVSAGDTLTRGVKAREARLTSGSGPPARRSTPAGSYRSARAATVQRVLVIAAGQPGRVRRRGEVRQLPARRPRRRRPDDRPGVHHRLGKLGHGRTDGSQGVRRVTVAERAAMPRRAGERAAEQAQFDDRLQRTRVRAGDRQQRVNGSTGARQQCMVLVDRHGCGGSACTAAMAAYGITPTASRTGGHGAHRCQEIQRLTRVAEAGVAHRDGEPARQRRWHAGQLGQLQHRDRRRDGLRQPGAPPPIRAAPPRRRNRRNRLLRHRIRVSVAGRSPPR